jgi:LCP family protein required for cell wall assembly
MAKGFLAGGAIVVLLAAVTVSGAALLFLHGLPRPQPLPGPPIELDHVAPGKPQTILVLGTDHRYGVGRNTEPVRSDTMMAVHLDPGRGATTVMSFPRDLQVQIPGHGTNKINAAYAIGGAKLAVKTVDSLGLDVSHVVGVDFHGFGRAVNTLGCVYVDVDRRYFNDNHPPVDSRTPYAAIDLAPGYQRLCGSQALDYVRFRHLDDDFVRAARQQDFLRQAKGQVGIAKALDERDELLSIFSKYTESDLANASDATMFGLIKLGYEASKVPVRQIPFPPTERGEGESLIVSPQALKQAIGQLERGGGAGGAPHKAGTGARQRSSAAVSARSAPGLVAARAEGERLALPAAAKLAGRLPVMYPRLRLARGGYATDEGVRTYAIKHAGGGSHLAYRLTLWQGDDGQYYGVQGTTWRSPPILAHPTDHVRMRGRTYARYYEGSRLRVIAWKTRTAAYWVSNTLSLRLSDAQMLAVARSLQRVGQ